jgi:hypothetical protein
MMRGPADGRHDRNVHGGWAPLSSREDSPYAPYRQLLEVPLASEQPAPRGLVGGLRHGGRTTEVPRGVSFYRGWAGQPVYGAT